jgi:glycerol-3-phosphate dehydrogenase
MARDRSNARYLPGIEFPDTLQAVTNLEDCLAGVTDILVAVPSHGLRETLVAIRRHRREESLDQVGNLSKPGFPRWITNLMTGSGDSAIIINAISSL